MWSDKRIFKKVSERKSSEDVSTSEEFEYLLSSLSKPPSFPHPIWHCRRESEQTTTEIFPRFTSTTRREQVRPSGWDSIIFERSRRATRTFPRPPFSIFFFFYFMICSSRFLHKTVKNQFISLLHTPIRIPFSLHSLFSSRILKKERISAVLIFLYFFFILFYSSNFVKAFSLITLTPTPFPSFCPPPTLPLL